MTALSVDEEVIPYEILQHYEHSLLTTQQELQQSVEVINTIDQHGADQATLSILGSIGLLSSVSLSSIATESLSNRISTDNLAIEALVTTAGEKAAAWSAKVLHVLKNAGATLLAIIKPIGDKLLEIIEKVKQRLKDKALNGLDVIKAHPFKTIAALLAAITAALAVLAFCGSGMPGGTASRQLFMSFFSKIKDMIAAIPWPFGKVSPVMGPTGSITIPKLPVVKPIAQTAIKGGWTPLTVDQVCTGSARAVGSSVKGATSFGYKAYIFTIKAIPKVFTWGDKFRRTAPVAIHAVTRSQALGHISYIGLSTAYYAFCLKAFFVAAHILYEVIGTALLIVKSTVVLFL